MYKILPLEQTKYVVSSFRAQTSKNLVFLFFWKCSTKSFINYSVLSKQVF